MNTFPAQGMTTTYDLSSVIPDSASTSTAIACGHKTRSGVIGMDAAGNIRYENIAETAKKKNFKSGYPVYRIPGPCHAGCFLRPCPQSEADV